jgi:hypothetical protein
MLYSTVQYSTAPHSTWKIYILSCLRGLVFALVLSCFLQYLTVYKPTSQNQRQRPVYEKLFDRGRGEV